MSDFIDALLDLGFDYGAVGGPDAFGTQIVMVGSTEIASQMRSLPIGEWQVGSRNISTATKDYLLRFWHSVRGQAHTFRYKDWNDYRVSNEPLELDGSAATQLIKTYGGFGNDFVSDITLPVVFTIVLEANFGAGWIVLSEDYDYSIAPHTGVVTWLSAPPDPDAGDLARWSGQFHKRVRFGADRFSLQFLGYEERGASPEAFYAVGALTVRESLLL